MGKQQYDIMGEMPTLQVIGDSAMKKYACLFLAAFAVFCFSPTFPADAAPKEKKEKPVKINKGKQKKVKRFARNALRWQKRFGKALTSATGLTIEELALKYVEEANNDDDSLPDFLELALGFNSCNEDSDGDGISDDDEYEDDETPGGEDEDEVEIEDLITELTDSSLTVGTTVFLLSDDTTWTDEEKNELLPSDFMVGDCVEAEGELQDDSSIVAEKVKLKDGDDCSEDDDDDDEDDEDDDS